MKSERLDKAAAGCVFYCEKTYRILLSLRSIMVLEPHTWGIWGGAIDGQESPQITAIREAEEEAGYQGSMNLVQAWVLQEEGFTYTTFVAFIEEEFTPDLNWETEDFIWCDLDQLPSPLHPGLEEALPGIIKVIYESQSHEA